MAQNLLKVQEINQIERVVYRPIGLMGHMYTRDLSLIADDERSGWRAGIQYSMLDLLLMIDWHTDIRRKHVPDRFFFVMPYSRKQVFFGKFLHVEQAGPSCT